LFFCLGNKFFPFLNLGDWGALLSLFFQIKRGGAGAAEPQAEGGPRDGRGKGGGGGGGGWGGGKKNPPLGPGPRGGESPGGPAKKPTPTTKRVKGGPVGAE